MYKIFRTIRIFRSKRHYRSEQFNFSGFGETGTHTASLTALSLSLSLSLDLPLAIEFFDSKDKIDIALEHLSKFIKHEHIVFWPAKAND